MKPMYKITRFYQSGEQEDVYTCMTLEEAQDHCKNGESSSRTCTSEEGCDHTEQYGPWFDGYDEM